MQFLFECLCECVCVSYTLCFCSFVGFVILCTWNFDPFFFIIVVVVLVILFHYCCSVVYLYIREWRTTEMLQFRVFVRALEEKKKKIWKETGSKLQKGARKT